jgi:anti-anti-sigma regulatory factor
MECRIQLEQGPDGCTVHLAGRLNAAQVYELRSICATVRGPLRIDLTDLLSADAVGIDALRRLRSTGIELTGVARYLTQWLV